MNGLSSGKSIIFVAGFCLCSTIAWGEVTAPKSVPAGSSFEAIWSGEEEKGRLRFLTEDEKVLAGGSCGSVSAKKKTIKLSASATDATCRGRSADAPTVTCRVWNALLPNPEQVEFEWCYEN